MKLKIIPPAKSIRFKRTVLSIVEIGGVEMKICKKEGVMKPLVEFYVREINKKLLYTSNCKLCHNAVNKKNKEGKEEQIAEYMKQYLKTYVRKSKLPSPPTNQ